MNRGLQKEEWQKLGWLLTGVLMAAIVVGWLVLWEGEPAEEMPIQDVPGVTPAPDEDEIEQPTGPLERPPGTAPADPRRPATVPYDSRSRSGVSDADEDRAPTTSGELTESDEASAPPSPGDHIPLRLDGDDSPDSSNGERDTREMSEDERRTRRDQWSAAARELRQQRLEGRKEEEPSSEDDEFSEVGEYPEGELASEESMQEEGWQEVDEYSDDDEMAKGEEAFESVDEWDYGDDRNSGDRGQSTSDMPDSPGASSPVVDEEADHVHPSVDAHAHQEPGDMSGRPPSDAALEGYSEYLDEAGVPAPEDAGLYAAMAGQHLADALYLMSAGRSLPAGEAARQRDDIANATAAGAEATFGEDEQWEESPDPESGDEEIDIDEIFGEDWTVWLDAADWLRFIQEEEYPELAHLVDEVMAAAVLLDPDLPGEEQVEELMNFFEAVQVVLEAMAIEDGEFWEADS